MIFYVRATMIFVYYVGVRAVGYRPARYARLLRGAGAVFNEMSDVTLGPHFLHYFFAVVPKTCENGALRAATRRPVRQLLRQLLRI